LPFNAFEILAFVAADIGLRFAAIGQDRA
jgi:hypothetical protein